MLTMKDGFPQNAPAPEVVDGNTLDVVGIFHSLRRQWPIVLAGIVLTLIASIIYLMVATPLFTSSASVILDPRQNALLQQQKVMAEGMLDASVVDSQVEVIGSDRLALDVIRRLNLTNDEEFVPQDTGGVIALIRGGLSAVKGLLGGGGPAVEVSPEQRAMDVFTKRLGVRRVGLTYVLAIDFTSQSPTKAAKIANTIATAYIEDDLRAKYDSTKRAGAWLQARLADLREQATIGDQAVQVFKTKNNLVDTSRGAMNEQQLAEINTQLISAKADTSQAKARLDRINAIRAGDVPDATVSDALQSPVVSRLRAQFLDIQGQVSQFTQRFGANHQATINLRSQRDDLKKSISDELKRLADAYDSDYQIAQAREASLQASLDQVVSRAGVNSEAQVKLRDLESTAETNRALYDSFLQMARQTTQQETFPVSDTRILADAAPPLIRSSPPKTMIVLLGAMMIGAIIGSGAALGREYLVDVFRTSNDVERVTGLTCLGILPVIDPAGSAGWRRFFTRTKNIGRGAAIHSVVLQAPFSRFTETLRNVKVAIDLNRLSRANKIIGVSSAVPYEGKSVVAANLAHLVASQGHRVLLIDGDLHVRSLSGTIAKEATAGLVEALKNPQLLRDLVVKNKRSNLDFLPCPVRERLTQASELIASPQMSNLLRVASEQYDYIFIDFPPIVPVVDAKAAAHLMDSFVIVIDWARTSKTVVLEALTSAENIRERVIGAVLNKADAVALKRIESYKGQAFNSYYVDEDSHAVARFG